MGARFKTREQPTSRMPLAQPALAGPRPGLPVALATAAAAPRPAAPDAARQAEALRDGRAEPEPEPQRDPPAQQDAEAEPQDGVGAEGEEEGADPAEGVGEVEGAEGGEPREAEGGRAAPEGGAAVSDRRATPLEIRPSRRPPFRKNPAPVVPRVEIPDRAYIRAPLVPPPPEAAVEKRLEILKSTGQLPESHHAAVQRAVNRSADRARAAQRNVIFRTGTIAGRARSDIEALAREIPGVVGAGVARIKAAATATISEIDTVADAQIRAVIDHVVQAEDGERDTANETAQRMHEMLMQEAPQVLRDAKTEMDAQLAAHAGQAGRIIARIKQGQEPQPIDNQVPAPPGGRASEAEDPEAPSGPSPPEPPTWAQAEAEIAGQLGIDLPQNRLTQYANMRCANALPGLVTPHREAYEEANQATIDGLTSEDTKRRFFENTMGLVVPAIREEERHTNRADDSAYIGSFRNRLGEEFMNLAADKRAIVRQIDEKRLVLKEETLNADHEKSLPHQAIKGLREAGAKVEQGLMDQARVIEATLKANLASLASQYPDLVARLIPIVQTGGFLEATATLEQIAAALGSIDELESGQIATVAEQARQAVRQARRGFDKQVAGLRSSASKSVRNIGEYGARAHYDLVRAGASYTGEIDLGVRQAFPQILAHAERTATRLLGPKENSRQGFSNIETAAINYLNNVMSGEWGGYVARLNGLTEVLGGIATGAIGDQGEASSDFGRIRQGVAGDSVDRAKKAADAMTPPPLSNADRVVLYGGAAVLAPFTLGASIGVVSYDVYSDPNESKIVEALAVPWPGPPGIDEAQTRLRNQTSLATLIQERLGGEGEQADILNLFSSDVGAREQAKTNLIVGSDTWAGISGEAALALTQSFTREELSADIMSADDRDRMGQALAGSLDSADDREIAAAYLNGEPDLALAIRMRRLFDRQQGKEYNDQLETGAQLDRLIKDELFAGGRYAHVPPAELERLRNAAFLRFEEASAEGRSRVTIDLSGPRPDALDQGSVTPTQVRTEGRQQLVYGPPLPPAMTVGYGAEEDGEAAAGPPAADAAAPAPAADAQPAPPATPVPSGATPAAATTPAATTGTGEPQSNDQAARAEPDLERAREAVIAYMNRPVRSYQTQRDSDYVARSLDRYTQMDPRHHERAYDRETGRMTLRPAASIQAYNRALITHGADSPEALGARAGATVAWMPNYGEPSENQINLINENFTDSGFNQARLRWENATPDERRRMRPQWERAQREHRVFLREAARNMGLEEGQLENDEAVSAFVTGQLGDRFARVDGEFRVAATEIVSQGRIGIQTGMNLAAEGWGTNERLMQNVMADRTQEEWNAPGPGGRGTMRDFARRVADSELSGDDWQQAKEKLRGPDSNDFERAATAQFLIDQQLEEGTGWLASFTMDSSWQKADLERRRGEVDARLVDGMQAGIEEARRRGIEIPDDSVPTSAYLPDGRLHPLARRFAMDGDGNLRGEGPSMGLLVGNVRQSADYYREEIDRQEGIFTSIITALAVIASVLALLIPGVNAIAAGILIALLAGAATVAVKSGMRGSRYGWEEAAVDIGTAAIEAATAGVGGALSKGARVAAAAKAAKAAGDAAEIAVATQKVAGLGRLGRAGAALHGRLGPTGAALVSEMSTSAVSASANAAMNDQMWDDGAGTGLLRMVGHGLQGAAASAVNIGVSRKITGSLDARLAPLVGDRRTAGALNRIGSKLSAEGREMLTEVVSGLAGSLSAEGAAILADTLRDADKMTARGVLERLGKAGLKELFTTTGRTAIQQHHRRNAVALSSRIMAEGRDPTPEEAARLTRLSRGGGLVSPDMTADEYASTFARARARIAEMPEALRPHLVRMSPVKALEVVAMLDSGQLGTRAARVAFTQALGKEAIGLDVALFDRLLVQANEDHAPARRDRKARIKETTRRMLAGISGPERAALGGLDLSALADLSPEQQARFARALAASEADFNGLADALIPANDGLRRRVLGQLEAAARATAQARTAVAARRARIADDLAASAPAELQAAVAGLRPRDAAALHRHLQDGSPDALRQAAAILRDAGLAPETASAVADRMAGRIVEQASRRLYMDNVPPEQRHAMGQLTPDALMEVRVAQFTRQSLSDARIEAILADVRRRRPAADLDALRGAIRATIATSHGRPGFRAALAQKRAFLDLVPFGMKRLVLRTPLITLPDEAFLTFVRGSGSENAVTLIVNGKPVVLMREGADPRKLAEEGLHVLQYHDPGFRERLAGLDEGTIARWDAMTLDEQVAAYREKVDIEIDGQRRMIARLQVRAEAALWPGTRALARKQLAQAEMALARLTARRGEVAGLDPDMRRRIELGLEDRPPWLAQPARLFSKGHADSALVDRHLPASRAPVRAAYYDLADRVAGLPRGERKRLLNLLRMMKGAVSQDDLVIALRAVNDSKDPAFAHLQKLAPDQVVDAVQEHLLTRLRDKNVTNPAQALKDRLAAKTFSADKKQDKALKALFGTVVDALAGKGAAVDPPALAAAKRVLFLALEQQHPNTSNAAIRQQLEFAAAVLGIGAPGTALTAVQGKPQIQAYILEALATNKFMLAAEHQPQASQAALIGAVQNLVEGGIERYPLAAQRAVFETLARSFYAGSDAETLMEIGNLPKLVASQVPGTDFRAARTVLMTSLYFLSQQPPARYKEILQKLGPLLAHAVDLGNFGAGEVAAGRVSITAMNRYIARALRHPTMQARFAASLIRLGHRAREKQALEGPKLADKDRAALAAGKPIAPGQESFLERHRAELAEPAVGQDVGRRREDVADDVIALAEQSAHEVILTQEEARAIAKRIEVLDQSAIFGTLVGGETRRKVLLEAFFAHLEAQKMLAPDDIAQLPISAEKREAALNRRGELIEGEFRKFVRELGSAGNRKLAEGAAMPLLEALAQGRPLQGPDGAIELSEQARVELLMILVRGEARQGVKPLPEAVQREIVQAKQLMVEAYLQGLGSERTPEMDAIVRASVDKLIAAGFLDIEKSAKGAMLEHMVEGLMELSSRAGKDASVTDLFGEVRSATESANLQFQSVDQHHDKTPRSLDNAVDIHKENNLPPGMKKGDTFGIDSKNGPGAFSPDQFKRYLIEMLNGAAGRKSTGGQDSIFGPEGLAGLIYMADSPANAKDTHAKAMKVIDEILAGIDGDKVKIQIGDETFEVEASLLRDHAADLKVLFGRIGQTAGTEATSSHRLGPFMIEDFEGEPIAERVRKVLGPPADEAAEDIAE